MLLLVLLLRLQAPPLMMALAVTQPCLHQAPICQVLAIRDPLLRLQAPPLMKIQTLTQPCPLRGHIRLAQAAPPKRQEEPAPITLAAQTCGGHTHRADLMVQILRDLVPRRGLPGLSRSAAPMAIRLFLILVLIHLVQAAPPKHQEALLL